MAGFDPDAYLKKKASPEPAATFDPDAYLSKKAGAVTPDDDGSTSATVDSEIKPHGLEVSALEAFGRQAFGGYWKNWSDEILGKMHSLRTIEGPSAMKLPNGEVRNIQNSDDYGDAFRDEQRQYLEASADQHPVASIAGNAVGDMTSDFVLSRTGLPVLSLPYQIVSGALSGAGAADNKTPGGKIGGGAIGAGAALVGHGFGKYIAAPVVRGIGNAGSKALGAISEPVREWVEKRIGNAVSQEAAEQAAKKEKLIRQASGGLGGEAAAGIKTLERLEEAAADESLPVELRKAAQDHLASPEMQALKERAMKNYVEKAPDQMGRIASAEEKLAQARGVDLQAATDDALADPVKKHIAPRVWTLGHRAAPALMGAAGGLVGGPAGAAVGGALGVGMALVQGRPGVIIRNMIREPAVRKAFWEKVLSAVPGPAETYAPAIRALEKAAVEGDQKFAVSAYVLSQQNPAARALLQHIADATHDQDDSDGSMAAR